MPCRDCFLSVSKSDSGENALVRWATKEVSNDLAAEQLGTALKEKLLFYPQQSSVDAQGISFLRNRQEVLYSTLILFAPELSVCCDIMFPSYVACQAQTFHSVDLPAQEPEKETIKGPVSQYNFFSMESRKLIRDDSDAAQVRTFYGVPTTLLVLFGLVTTY